MKMGYNVHVYYINEHITHICTPFISHETLSSVVPNIIFISGQQMAIEVESELALVLSAILKSHVISAFPEYSVAISLYYHKLQTL